MGRKEQPKPPARKPAPKVAAKKATRAKSKPAPKPRAPRTPRAPYDPATSTRWHAKFLEKYGELGIQTAAMRAIGVPQVLLRRHRRKYPEFDEAVKELFEVVLDTAEDELVRRGRDGYDEPVIYKGQLSMIVTGAGEKVPLTVKKFSDNLLLSLLQAGRPTRYRTNLKVQVDDIDREITAGLEKLAAIEKDLAT